MSTDCFICRISKSTTSRFINGDLPSYDRPIVSDDLFLAFPGMGQFIEGYLLLSPREHAINLGLLSSKSTARFFEFKQAISERLSKSFGAPIFFEHGAASSKTLPPCCTEHSHLHAVPMHLTKPPTAVANELPGGRIESFDEVRRWAEERRPYFYMELSDGAQYLYEANELPSQFGRRVLAELCGLPDEWDWAAFPYFERMENVQHRLCANPVRNGGGKVRTFRLKDPHPEKIERQTQAA